MGRQKNPQPKRRREEKDLGQYNGRHKRRREVSCRTTDVIPADTEDGLFRDNRLPSFAKDFENKFLAEIKREYLQAVEKQKTDRNGWYRGYRMITGSRFEIKVLGDFFTTLPGWEGLSTKLIQYAEKQAKRDARVNDLMKSNDYTFSEWSIIASEDCEEQSIHVDVPANNLQFGLILNDQNKSDDIPPTPGTRVLIDESYGPYTVEALLEEVWPDAPQELKECFSNKEVVKERVLKVLDGYGPLFRPRGDLESHMVGAETLKEDNQLCCGDLICTSGGIPHAGPLCSSFRMVMFGAVSPNSRDLYNVDDQYFAHSAMLFLIQAVWDYLQDHDQAKTWLLTQLSLISREYEEEIILKHDYVSPSFTAFMIDARKASDTNATQRNIKSFLHIHGSKKQDQLFLYLPSHMQRP